MIKNLRATAVLPKSIATQFVDDDKLSQLAATFCRRWTFFEGASLKMKLSGTK